MLLRLGSTFGESGGDLVTVLNYYAHPRHGWAHPENSYDIALVVPTEFIELDGASKMVKPLANFDQNFAPDHRCVIAGYGMTMEKQEDAQPPRLHYVMMKVRDGQMCKMSFGKKFAEKLMICSGYLQVNAGACAGDSGGPLFCSGVL
jgi:secreted trypsin-like serine protease